MSKQNESIKIKNLKIRKAIHPYMLVMMSSKVTGELTVDGKFPNDTTCLIVANHLCIEDIPTLAQAVEEHFYILVSDEDKYTLDGLGLSINGVRWVKRTDKIDRREAAEEIPKYLKAGVSFAMYPEATWNLSPNLLVLPLNYGCIRMALEAEKPILPVVSFFDEKERHTVIGDMFYPTEDLGDSISELRDKIASIVYEEIHQNCKNNIGDEKFSVMIVDGEEYFYQKRDSIEPDYWDKHVDDLYEKYSRARKDKSGVRKFESQFIYTPKTDDYAFFQEFNSVVRYDKDGKPRIKRISSERNGYDGTNIDSIDFKDFFEYGYNEEFLKTDRPKVMVKEAKSENV